MRKLFYSATLLFFFIIANLGISQGLKTDSVFIHADSLDKRSISLTNLWRFHPGDDSTWSEPDLDHSGWDTLNTQLNSIEVLENKWTGIGWFRKVLVVDSSLFGGILGIRAYQHGASEIFLNGKLIRSFGKIDSAGIETAFNPRRVPFIVRLDSAAYQVLAVRFANHTILENPHLFLRFLENPGFSLILSEVERSIQRAINNIFGNTVINTLMAGVFLALFLLYLLLFVFYSRRKVNLYYSIFTFCLGLIFLGNPMQWILRSGMYPVLIADILSVSAFVLLFFSYVWFLYSIFYEKRPKHSIILLILSILMEIWLFTASTDTMVNYALFAFIALMTGEGLRIIIIAIRKKMQDAWVIGTGVIAFFFFFVFITVMNIIEPDIPNIVALLVVFIGILSVPISMSIYLARNVAKTSHDLEKQLETVKELSEKELDHQKKNAELQLRAEKDRAASRESELRAQAAELQAKAAEAQAQVIQAENDRKTRELEEARDLQLSMLPESVPQLGFLEIGAYMQTATEVGGDYYDFHINDKDNLTVVIGDATGHGLKAGTLVTAAKSLFTSHADENNILDSMQDFNSSIKKLNFRFLFMCLLLMKINRNSIRFSSAGMPPMLIYRSKTKKVDEILLKGLPLGSKEDFRYEEKEVKIASGDTIILMSDGYPELLNNEGEMFGYDRVVDVFAEVGDRSNEEIIDYLKSSASDWTGGKDPNDDVTFVLIKVK